jgi:hypothetical protein
MVGQVFRGQMAGLAWWVTGLASFTAQAGQTGVTTYGGRVGLNYMIN